MFVYVLGWELCCCLGSLGFWKDYCAGTGAGGVGCAGVAAGAGGVGTGAAPWAGAGGLGAGVIAGPWAGVCTGVAAGTGVRASRLSDVFFCRLPFARNTRYKPKLMMKNSVMSE